MHTHSLPDKTPYEMVHSQKPNLHNTYKWGKDVFVKIKQDDKLAHRATKVKWIGHCSQSNGHLIYWPSVHKVSVERNLVSIEEKRLNYLLHYHLMNLGFLCLKN